MIISNFTNAKGETLSSLMKTKFLLGVISQNVTSKIKSFFSPLQFGQEGENIPPEHSIESRAYSFILKAIRVFSIPTQTE